jgi:hypothetical protein
MHPDNRTVGELAYRLWQARGCPDGTAEQDWLEAERQLAGEKLPSAREASPPASEAPPPAREPTTPSGERPTRARALRSKPVSANPSSDRLG